MAVTACRIDLAQRRIEVVESIPRGRGAAQYAPTGTSNSQPQGRIRRDIIDAHGKITLRHKGRLHHIGVGRTHARTPILMLINGLDIRIIHPPRRNHSPADPQPSRRLPSPRCPQAAAKAKLGVQGVRYVLLSRDITWRTRR